MELLYGYIILSVFVIGLNVIPAFMPPTWTVLVFFYITYHLAPVPVVLIGAFSATFGRILLYYLAKNRGRPFLSKSSKQNLSQLKQFFHKRQKISIPLLFLYAFSPVPSNQVYILAGLSDMDIRLFASVFFIGRLLSYSFWVGSAHLAVKNLPQIFNSHYSHDGTIIVEILGFGGIYIITKIPWKKYLK